MSNIQDYFECIIKKHQNVTDNPPVKIYVNKVENRITFRTDTGYYLQLLMTETMKLLGTTKSKITKGKNGGNVSHLEITEKILVYCNVVNNSYQCNLRVFYTFIPNKSFGQLLDISPKKFIISITFNSEFSYVELFKILNR